MVVCGKNLGGAVFEVGFGSGALLILNLLRPSIRGRRTAPASGTNVGGVPPGRVKAWHKWSSKACRGTERADLFGPERIRALLLPGE